MLIQDRKDLEQFMDYMSAPEAAKKWGISEHRVRKLCEDNRISVVERQLYVADIQRHGKPADGRRKELSKGREYD